MLATRGIGTVFLTDKGPRMRQTVVATVIDVRSARPLGRQALALGRRLGFSKSQCSRHMNTLLWFVTYADPKQVREVMAS